MTDVYSDTWSWLKLDKEDELVLNGHIKKRIGVLETKYEIDRRKKDGR